MAAWRILLADPDLELLSSYREFLSCHGHQVEVAATGSECLAKLQIFRPDVLILEPQIPWAEADEASFGISGREPPPVTVIVLSASVEPDSLFHVKGFSVRAYYVKPIAPEDLDACIRRLLEGGRHDME